VHRCHPSGGEMVGITACRMPNPVSSFIYHALCGCRDWATSRTARNLKRDTRIFPGERFVQPLP
jgi:hypothetical protein